MSDAMPRVEMERQPRKCPTCGHSPVASILYGKPAFTESLRRKIRRGRVALGGCVMDADSPVWQCTGCGLRIFFKGPQ